LGEANFTNFRVLFGLMKRLQDAVKQLIESKSYANFATIMPDGSPHVTQTWVDHDGDTVLINTFEGSQKHKNATRDPRVALDVCDPASPYHMAVIRGRVVQITFDGAEEHIDRMAQKYLGQPKYPMRRPGVRRVLIKIEPSHVIAPFTDSPRWQSWNAEKGRSD
jgi:PPOX class probable F420-dependent enzyme